MEKIKHIQKTLTPIILQEGMPGFETVRDIEEKLNEPDVFNIAITGPYGAGKSTVLKSLVSQYPSHNYLTISLASLTGDNKDVDLDEEEQQKVEYSLLQQLIYKEKPETLPNSRFRRIVSRTVWGSVLFGLSIIGFILSLLVVFEPAWLKVESLFHFFDLGEKWNLFFDLTCSVYILLFVFKLIAYIYRHSLFSRIRALNVKNVKIELNQDSSVFNKHLEEIVYFFESTDYNVVIIEDLDRFRCPEIFQKLREINFLLRQSKVLKAQHRTVKFIYAIKDDLFKDAERTKFFDYIVTVIPVVNPKNSCEKLTQELAERGYRLDKDALKELSEFLNDMRMLKNVVNEFQQYMERLSKSSTPNKEMLLAMIIYKNHHPDDFGKLHYKDGAVYKFISKKADWIKIATDKVITPRMQVWEKKRDDLIKSQIFTLKQWRMLYMARYREHLRAAMTSISVQGQGCSMKAIADSEELFEDLIKQKRVTYTYRNYNQNYSDTIDNPFATIEKEVDEKLSYFERKKLLSRPPGEIDDEIRMLRDEENSLKNFKLAKLLIQFPEIKKDERFIGLGLSELMVYFLQRGYIDETYYDYLTLYDGTTMSLNDRDLLSRIRQNDPNVNYNEVIDDVEAFVEDLPLFVYDYKSILNYQIADYLESHSVIYKTALQSFEQHIVSSATPPLDFMANYYSRGGNGVVKLWSKYVKAKMSWLRIQTYEKQEYWDVLVEAWLLFCEPADVSEGIKEWLNNNLGFCIERLNAIGVEHFKDIIKECKFSDLTSLGPIGGQLQGEDVMDVANYILDNRLFELSDINIWIACQITVSPFDEIISADSVTISDILDSSNDGFKEYALENIQRVFNDFISKSKGQESENGLIYILNHEEIDDDQKVEFLQGQTKHKVLDIMDIKDAYKPLSIRGNVLYPCWENILAYYAFDHEMISDDLEGFINENVDRLLNKDYPTENSSAFASDIVYGAYLSMPTYEKLLPFLIRYVGKDDEEKFSKDTGIERAKLLVRNNYLSDNAETSKVVAQFGTPLYAKYLSYHINSLIGRYDDYEVDTKTLSVLLDKGSSLTNSQHWNLAKKVPAELVKLDSDLANVLMSLMMKRKEELSWSVVEAVLNKATQTATKKQFQEWLIKRYLSDVDKEKIILKSMRYPYSEVVDDTKRPLVPKDFKEYLDLLAPLGLFTSNKEEEKGYRVFHSTKQE